MTTITVAPPYVGIPGIAHGGFAAGLLAQECTEPVRVVLRRPPQLGTQLRVENGAGPTTLLDPEGHVVMEARSTAGLGADLPSVTAPQAGGQAPHPRFDRHPYPVCFVCGSDRDDGFRLRFGPDGDGLTVGVWTPSGPLLPEREVVPGAFVWAVVDCVTAWTFADHWDDPAWWPALTGQLAVEQVGPVRRDREHVVAGRLVGRDGRRIHVHAAVEDAEGRIIARAEAVWVVVPEAPGEPAAGQPHGR